MTIMNEFVLEALKDFGLTNKESEVYIYLAKSCIQKAGTISKRLRMHKAQVYRILRNLRSKGLVESTKDRTPLKLIYYEACVNRNDATRREKYLKTYHGKMFLKRRLKSYLTG